MVLGFFYIFKACGGVVYFLVLLFLFWLIILECSFSFGMINNAFDDVEIFDHLCPHYGISSIIQKVCGMDDGNDFTGFVVNMLFKYFAS